MSRSLWLLTGTSLAGLLAMAATFLVTEAQGIRAEQQRAVQQTAEVAHALIAHNMDDVNATVRHQMVFLVGGVMDWASPCWQWAG